MALVTCGVCGRSYSPEDGACPNCGTKPRSGGCVDILLAAIFILVAVCFLLMRLRSC